MSEQTKHKAVSGKYTNKGTPNGVTSITPFITVKDPSEAIEFYKVVFNARVKDITEHPDGNRNTIIVHAELDFGNGFLQLGGCKPGISIGFAPRSRSCMLFFRDLCH